MDEIAKQEMILRETICLQEIMDILQKHRCEIRVNSFDIVEGKIIPKVTICALAEEKTE